MAEIILSSAAADWMIGRLANLAAQEVGSVLGVTQELEDLQDTLSMVKALLHDADQMKRIGSEGLKHWLGRLEDVIDEAEDLMDEFSTQHLQRKVKFGGNNKLVKKVRTFFSSSNQVAFRLQMANKIKEIKMKLDKIKEKAEFLNLVELPKEHTNIASIERDTHSFVLEENVTGRDEDKKAMLKLLMDNENEIEGEVLVIPIVGVGGLGKTTLAQLVFNDKRVQENFDLQMWVRVSEDFNVKLLVEKIIKSATDKSPGNHMEQLRKDLHKEINGKRYLLVLDDVWNEEPGKWQSLKELLVVGAKGSRIILTTRSERVANIVSFMEPYHLGRLDSEKSWMLFRKMAFKKGEELKDFQLSEFKKKIVKKCGGVPLTIKTIGRMLYFKKQEEWLSVVENELYNICQNKNEDIFQTLKLSYDHLPSYLKPCFLCCSLFPKDYKIKVEMLIKLWMAQGFITSMNQKKGLEEVGYEYFLELLCRSFFQDIIKDVSGNIVSCKMHDLMHDLAISLGEKKCITLDLKKRSTIGKEARHLSFDFQSYSPNQISTSWSQAKRVRSVFLSHNSYNDATKYKSFCKEIFFSFKFLRFLDLHALQINVLSNSIGELRWLRYLDLSKNRIQALPKSITKLLNLQTLKLNGCYSLKELPRDIERLVNLRHLEVDGCRRLTHMPKGLSQLTNLQTLSTFVSRQGTDSSLPSWLPLSLVRFELHSYKKCQCLPLLNQFCYLEILKLEHMPTLEYVVSNSDSFVPLTMPSLKILHLKYLPKLKSWWKDIANDSFPSDSSRFLMVENHTLPSVFPCLLELEIYDCPLLNNMPLYPCAESVWLENTSSKPLEETILNTIAMSEISTTTTTTTIEEASSSTSSTVISTSLSKLKSLTLLNIENLQSLPDAKSLTSLKQLELIRCSKLKSMGSFIQHLSSLQRLSIYFCEELIEICNDDDASTWQGLRSLRDIKLWGLPKLVALPEGLQHVTTLQTMELQRCGNLMAIPDWIGNFTSLTEFSIWNCPNLTSLPESIQDLASLNTLTIWGCPVLMQRCQREIGEDWPKIAHIPHLYLKSISKEDSSTYSTQKFFKNFRVPQLCFK